MADTAPAGSARVAVGGLVLSLAVGAFLLFWNLGAQSIFVDEAFALDTARMPLGAMLQQIAAHDAHPPLFYLLAHVAVGAIHWPPTWYRYLAAPFGLATIACTWALARRAFGDVAAAAAAMIVATEPTLLLFDRLFRMYALLAAVTALSCLFLIWASSERTAPRARVFAWIGYLVAAIALPYLQYLGGIVVACQGAYALFGFRRRWPAIACGAAALAALMPWWWGIREQLPQAGFAGGHALSLAWSTARELLGFALPVDWYRNPAFDIAFALAALAVIVGGLFVSRGGALAMYAAPLAVAVAATVAFGRNLTFGRYLVHLIPGFALAVSAVSTALSRTAWRVAGFALVAAVLASNAVADADLLLDKFYQLSDWDTVTKIMAAHERRSDAILLVQGYSYYVLRGTPALAGHDVFGPEVQSEVPHALAWLDAHGRDRVWYVENQAVYADPSGAIEHHLAATRPRLREWLEPRADPSSAVFFALYGPMKHPATHRR